ncbi:hypothetical protein HHL16_08055 [Pseudoflavitalea sp. G-6-1-2]|uniref:hypothetical protein n=1 Tax=Pseudoflavitalea sp. G-6-1-2 TaxID=2728841 RepID=UPI00146C0194|nr:hypothetical protein [Pseudoflavitalea sp. G-6-1-2]NML20823.1 hypothetical protein [Pseudoflavitalea sp. G-6-1-2]
MNVLRVYHTSMLLLCIVSAQLLHAQEGTRLFTEKGAFLAAPAGHPLDAKRSGYSDAQIQAFFSNMKRFMEKMHQSIPCINPPHGYNVNVWNAACSNGTCSDQKVMAGVTGLLIRPFLVSDKDPAPKMQQEGASIKVYVNDMVTMLMLGSREGDWFYEPKIIETIDGCPVYEGGFLVLTKNKKPLFAQVPPQKVEEKLPGMSGKLRLVVPNPAFYDSTRKTELQLVIIDLFRYKLKKEWGHELIAEIRKTFDVPALLKELN